MENALLGLPLSLHIANIFFSYLKTVVLKLFGGIFVPVFVPVDPVEGGEEVPVPYHQLAVGAQRRRGRDARGRLGRIAPAADCRLSLKQLAKLAPLLIGVHKSQVIASLK